jgi:uncharacterized protein YkwD
MRTTRPRPLVGVLVLLAVAAAVAASAAARGTRSTSADATLEAQVLAKVNQVRRGHGLVPLRFSKPLGTAAEVQAAKMGQLGFFSHDSADGSPFWKRVQRFYGSNGYSYWSVGENLLWASPDIDAAGALALWMKSPEHRANLLERRWREVGIAAVHVSSGPGVFDGDPVTIVDADFGVRH